MNEIELIRPFLIVAAVAGVLLLVVLAAIVLRASSRHGGLRQGIDAMFRKPVTAPKTAGKKHYYIPYWLSR